MHWIQEKILELSKIYNLDDVTDTELTRLVNCAHQSQIRHHRDQLLKNGKLIRKNNRLTPALSSDAGLIRIPIMGEADCGEATKYADGRVVDTLAVSPSILSTKNHGTLYALIARGNSMNHAQIAGKEICDRDYIIVEKTSNYTPKDNEVIVSIIGGLANIKRFKQDPPNERLLLLSDSYQQQHYAPIVISQYDDFQVDGKVVDVIKAVT